MNSSGKTWVRQQVVLTVRNWLVMTNYAEHKNWPSEMFLDRAMYGAYYYMGVGLAGQDVPVTFNGQAEEMYGFKESSRLEWGSLMSKRWDATVVDIALHLCGWIIGEMRGESGSSGYFDTTWYIAVVNNFGVDPEPRLAYFFDEWGRTEWAGMAKGDEFLDELPLGVLYR